MRDNNKGYKPPLSEFMFVWINLTYSENVTDITDTLGPCLSTASPETQWKRLFSFRQTTVTSFLFLMKGNTLNNGFYFHLCFSHS